MWASLYSMHIGTSYSLEGCVNISTDCKNIVGNFGGFYLSHLHQSVKRKLI